MILIGPVMDQPANQLKKADYIASFSADNECICLSLLLAFMLNKHIIPPITLPIHKQSTMKTSKASSFNHLNKLIDIRYHFVYDAVRKILKLMEHCISI